MYARRGREWEVANKEYLEGESAKQAVHESVCVVGETEVDGLFAEPFSIGCLVGVFDAYQYEQSATYARLHFPLFRYRCVGYPLYDDSHDFSFFFLLSI